jgi:hypothetical protein
MNIEKTSQQDVLPKTIIEFINIFMRAINSGRLYSKGHDLHRKNVDLLFMKLQDTLGDNNFIFLGCAKKMLYLEGDFFQADDLNLKKFLEFAHTLRVFHFLLDKDITIEELEVFIDLLASAKQGEGEGVAQALSRDHIGHAKIGLLDYSVYSTVQTVAAQLSYGTGDEALWRQLIVQPASVGTFSIGPEKVQDLIRLSEDKEELKKLLLQIDAEMMESETGASIAQRGILLANFIQNLGDAVTSVDPEKSKIYARQVGGILHTMEPQVKTQILGSLEPYTGNEERVDIIHEIIQAMPDEGLIDLLTDGLKGPGAGSECFNNLFNRALIKYKEPGLLLKSIRSAMDQAARDGKPGNLQHWQHLEQLIIQREEINKLNEQYIKEIEALATSIQMKQPMVEEEEMKNLMQTLSPEFLAEAKARLIIDLMGQYRPERDAPLITSLLENLRDILAKLFEYNNLYTMGELMREVYLLLSNYPEDDSVKKTVYNMLSAKEIGKLIQYPLDMCRTFEPEETKVLDAICQLYPERGGDFLLDILLKEKGDGPKADWLYRTLASIGPRMSRALGRHLHEATEIALPRLLNLIAMSEDQHLYSSVETLLQHDSHEVQLMAINTIGKLKAERAVPRLEQIVSKKSWIKSKKMKEMQEAAARALSKIGTRDAREVLKRIAEEGSGDLKRLCRELL